jgi:hypothetical protein
VRWDVVEVGLELAAAVDLKRTYRKRHARLNRIEESRGGYGGSATADFDCVPARGHVAGGEVLEHHAGQGPQVQGVNLDQVARRVDGEVAYVSFLTKSTISSGSIGLAINPSGGGTWPVVL